MHYNVKKERDSFDLSSSSFTNTSINNNRLTLIDILVIDNYSRLTLTKKFKKLTSLNPNDNLIVYQDQYNRNIILKVQQDEKIVDSWILTRGKDKTINNNNARASGYISYNTDNPGINLQDITNQNKEDTLYRLPILLVDDDEDLLTTFAMFLKYEGYNNIKTFSDSRNVLKYYFDVKNPLSFRLAIIDIRMPKINGIQLYQILKIIDPSLKIIFLTSLDAIDEIISIYPNIKSTDIISKPIDNSQFIKIINDKVSEIGTN